MPLPQLPPDIWFRIASISDAATLASLSQVNRIFHKLAMHDTHFMRHLPAATNLHPRQAFRRVAALQYPPPRFVTSVVSNFRLVSVVGDAALLLDPRRRTLLAYPSGYAFPIDRNIESHRPITRRLYFSIPESLVHLYDQFVAFIYGSRWRPNLFVFDLRTGHTTKLALRPFRNAVRNKDHVVFMAGIKGEFIAQRQNATTLVLFNWRDGSVAREYTSLDERTVFVNGEFSAANGDCIVGYATCNVHQGVKEVSVTGFDGVNTVFRIDADRSVKSVLRSEDTLTHVLLMSQSPEAPYPTDFIAHSRRGKDKWWSGELKKGFLRLELRENGRLLVNRPLRGKSATQPRWHSEWLVWVLLKETDKQWGAVETVAVEKRVVLCPSPLWMRRIEGREYVLMQGREKNTLSLLQLRRKGSKIDEVVWASWVIDNLDQAIVVADHFILATDKAGKLHLAHFNKFCNGSGGVYACPLHGLSTYTLFPEEFRGGDELLQGRKRRRVGEASDPDVVQWD